MIKGKVADRSVTIDGVELTPDESRQMINHSPDGFAWGYSGSGPSQLALAIMLRFTTKYIAQRYYHRFKEDMIATLDKDEDFEIPTVEVKNWLALNVDPFET